MLREGWMDGWMSSWVDGWKMDGQMVDDGWMNG